MSNPLPGDGSPDLGPRPGARMPHPGPVLLCCGLTTLDLLQGLDHLPGPDEKVQADWAMLQVGGPAANAALTAQLLGLSSRLLTVLGAGPLGGAASTELADGGVEVVDATPRGCAWQLPVSTVLVTAGTGERAVVSANTLAAPALDPAPDEVALVALAGVTAVLVDGHHH